MLNTDRFNSVPVLEAADTTMRALNGIQMARPEAQMHAACALFSLLCERFGVNPQDVMTSTKNLMNYAEGRRPEFAAVQQYMENEL